MATFLFFKNQSGAGILHVLVAVYLTQQFGSPYKRLLQ